MYTIIVVLAKFNKNLGSCYHSAIFAFVLGLWLTNYLFYCFFFYWISYIIFLCYFYVTIFHYDFFEFYTRVAVSFRGRRSVYRREKETINMGNLWEHFFLIVPERSVHGRTPVCISKTVGSYKSQTVNVTMQHV